MLRAIALIVCVSVSSASWASLATNPITGTNPNTANPYTAGQTLAANLSFSGIGRGAGATGTNANDRYNANSWNTTSIDLDAYFTFTLTPASGFEIDFDDFVYTGQRSGTGPTLFAFRSSVDSFASDLGTPTATGTTIDLSSTAYQGVIAPIEFRLYAWGTTNSGGTFSVNDFTFNGTASAIAAIPEPTAFVFWGLATGAAGLTYVARRRRAGSSEEAAA